MWIGNAPEGHPVFRIQADRPIIPVGNGKADQGFRGAELKQMTFRGHVVRPDRSAFIERVQGLAAR